jgi:hypothetical protein
VLQEAPVSYALNRLQSSARALYGQFGENLSSEGWTIIGDDEVFSEAVFNRHPDTTPAGENPLWTLTKESGRFENRLRHPPRTPGMTGRYLIG